MVLGGNGNGEIGFGHPVNRVAPTQVLGLTSVRYLAEGDGRSNMAITITGEIYSWGYNDSGSLGLGNPNDERYLTIQRILGF